MQLDFAYNYIRGLKLIFDAWERSRNLINGKQENKRRKGIKKK